MAQDGIEIVQPDDWRINMSDPWQVLWWSRYLGLSKTELETAICVCGTLVVDIKHYLATHDVELCAIQAPRPPEYASGSIKGHGFQF